MMGRISAQVPRVQQRLPALLHLADLRHIRHRAAGIQIRQDHLLAFARQHVGALRHEMHAAKEDVVRVRLRRRFRQFVAVAGEIREADHFVALVVVPQQDRRLAQRAPRHSNALIHAVIRQDKIVVEGTHLGRCRYINLFKNTHDTPPSVRFGRALCGLAPIWTGMLKAKPGMQSARCGYRSPPSQRGCCSLYFLDAPVAGFVAKTAARKACRCNQFNHSFNNDQCPWRGRPPQIGVGRALFVTRESRQVS